MAQKKKYHVGLFVTCLADLFRPSIATATAKILRNAGYRVSAPKAQTCCGQPAYNSGDQKTALQIAKKNIKIFQKYDFVITPSGSCAAMIKIHFPKLIENDEKWTKKAQKLARKTWEITSFISEMIDEETQKKIFKNIIYEKTVTYHDACAGLRELGIKKQPRKLLKMIKGIHMNEMENPNICCGFGGTFCVKYPDISNNMVNEKIQNIKKTKAQTIVAGDLGCLMNIAGKIKRDNMNIKTRHIIEILAGETQSIPAIAEPNHINKEK